MRKAGRREFQSETGLISVSAVIGLALVALFIYLLLGAFQGDSAYYGTVLVPSQGTTIDLPKGETDVYYAEPVDKETVGEIVAPEDLNFTISDESGQAVRVDSRGGDTESTDDGSARAIAAVQAPEEGTYTVGTTSSQIGQRTSPTLTFGLAPIGAVRERFGDVVDELDGPTGIVVLIALGILFLAPRIARAVER